MKYMRIPFTGRQRLLRKIFKIMFASDVPTKVFWACGSAGGVLFPVLHCTNAPSAWMDLKGEDCLLK